MSKMKYVHPAGMQPCNCETCVSLGRTKPVSRTRNLSTRFRHRCKKSKMAQGKDHRCRPLAGPVQNLNAHESKPSPVIHSSFTVHMSTTQLNFMFVMTYPRRVCHDISVCMYMGIWN